MSWSTARPWLLRSVLLLAALRGLSSESGVVSQIAMYTLFGLLPSFGQLFGRAKRVAPVLQEGDARIVLQEATWRDWVKIKRVLHEDLNVDYPAAREMFRDLPVTLEPAVLRSYAEQVVAKLNKAGAIAAVVT